MKIYLIIIITFFTISCQEYSLEPNMSNQDKELFGKVIGNWNYGNILKRSFLKDNIFIDSTFIRNDGTYLLESVKKGEYIIRDSVISYINFYYTYLYAKEKAITFNGGESIYSDKIKHINDNLSLVQCEVYEADGKSEEIYGTWILKKWWSFYFSSDDKITGGFENYRYTFLKSNRLLLETQYLFESRREGGKFEGSFIYKSPNQIKISNEDYEISIITKRWYGYQNMLTI